jgi:hypothetical protein
MMTTQALRRWLLGGMLVGAAGCGIGDNETFHPRFQVNTGSSLNEIRETLEVELHGISAQDGCFSLPGGAKVTLNDKPVNIESRGSRLKFMHSCESVKFSAPTPASSEGTSTFMVSDWGDERVVEFQNLAAPMTVRRLAPQEGPLRPGQGVVLERSPATDTVYEGALYVILRDATGREHRPAELSQEENRVSFVIPAGLAQGEGSIELRGRFRSGVTRCDFAECSHDKDRSAEQPVTFAAP